MGNGLPHLVLVLFILMPNEEQINALGDARISAYKQLKGDSLEDQENIIRNHATRHNWEILKIFSKVYSGRAEERADFEEILKYIKKLKADRIKIHFYLIKSIDRFTRDGAITYEEMKDRLSDIDVQLIDAYGIIQPVQNTLEHLGFEYKWSKRSPTATAQLVEAQRAKDEVTDILTRMVGASIRRVKDGYKVRQPNDGFINKHIFVEGKEKVIEIPDPERAHFWQTIFELRARNLNDKEIVEKINAMGYKTREYKRWSKDKMKIIGRGGGHPLTVKQMQRAIQRPIYAGIKCEKWTNYKPIRARYDGLVSIEVFNLANRGKIFIKETADGSLQLLYNYSQFEKSITKRLRDNPDYRYKFFLCPLCHKPFLGSRSRGKSGERYPAYHCGGNKNGARTHKYIRIPKEEFENTIKKYVMALRFDEKFLESLELVLNDTYRNREKEIVSQSSMISHNVGSLKAQQVTVLDTLTTTQSSVARKKLEEKIDDLELQIIEAQNQRGEIEVTERDVKSFVKYVKTVMEHPSEVLINTDNMRAQRTLFGLVFEEMPTYQEILNGTPKLSLVFKLSKEWNNSKSQSVDSTRIELVFPQCECGVLPLYYEPKNF